MTHNKLSDLIWALALTPSLKLVLLALARSADDAGVCHPLLADTFLQQTGFTVNQIGHLLNRLVELGRLGCVSPPDAPLVYGLVLDDLGGWRGGAS
jgi:hypothetical protein